MEVCGSLIIVLTKGFIKEIENIVSMYFFLLFVSEQGKLEVILMSVTGCDKIPPGGFDKKIRTSFTPIRENSSFMEDVESSPMYFNTCETLYNS